MSRQQNLTIVLTTHYIEEAQQLCSRVAMMHKGSLKCLGTPQELIDGLGKYAVDCPSTSRFFKHRQEVLAYLSELDEDAVFRQTNLEDVFVR